MVDIDELERLRGALENIGNLSLDGCIKVNTPHGLWVGTPDAYAREVLGMPWRAPEGHQRMTDTEIRELRAGNARLREAMKGPLAWLERWAVHVGNCETNPECTCGLMLAQHELRAALGEPQ